MGQFSFFKRKLQEDEISKRKYELPYPVYYVESPSDATVLLGMDVVYDGEIIRWFDAIKIRMMLIDEILTNECEKFSFQRRDGDGGTYTFIPMTIEIYYEKVKRQLAGVKDFDNEDKLLQAFLDTKKLLIE